MINKKELFLLFKKLNYDYEDKNDGKNYRYFHAIRVLNLSNELAKKGDLLNKINPEALWVLALFHDLGRNEKLFSNGQIVGNDATKDMHNVQLFIKYVFPLIDDEKLKQELNIIIEDFSSKKFEKTESRLVKDADDLDELGILNFWRMAVFSGKHNQDLQETIDFFYRHDLAEKQEKMNKLFFNFSKEIADARNLEMSKMMDSIRDINDMNIPD